MRKKYINTSNERVQQIGVSFFNYTLKLSIVNFHVSKGKCDVLIDVDTGTVST